MRQLQSLQTQVSYLGSQISRANQDRLQMQSQISILKDRQTAVAKEQPLEQQTQAYKEKNDKLAAAENDVKNVETQLNLLLQRYSDSYPDVQSMRGRLKIAKQIRDELVKEDAATKKSDPASAANTPAPARPANPMQARELRDLDGQIRTLQAAIEAKDLEVGGLQQGNESGEQPDRVVCGACGNRSGRSPPVRRSPSG